MRRNAIRIVFRRRGPSRDLVLFIPAAYAVYAGILYPRANPQESDPIKDMLFHAITHPSKPLVIGCVASHAGSGAVYRRWRGVILIPAFVVGLSFPLAYVAQIWTQAPTTFSDLLRPNLVTYWIRYFGKDHLLRLPESMVLTAIGIMFGRTIERGLQSRVISHEPAVPSEP